MDWNKNYMNIKKIDNIKNLKQKQILAEKVAEKIKDGQVIGFGSGSTSYLATIAIANKMKEKNIKITAIPTSLEIKMLCSSLNIPTASLIEKKPDWSFDGADEVDDNNWLIKGRGGAMFKEKLNIVNSPMTYILVDESKKVENLGENFKIPVECFKEAINYIKLKLIELGGQDIELREAVGKDGPIITENGNLILDVKFNNIEKDLENKIKSISGVIESGLFIGYNIQLI